MTQKIRLCFVCLCQGFPLRLAKKEEYYYREEIGQGCLTLCESGKG